MLPSGKTGLPPIQTAREKDLVPVSLWPRESGGCSSGLHRPEPGPVRRPGQRQRMWNYFLFMRCGFCWLEKMLIISCVPPPQDVINAMNVNPRISFPPEVDFVLISGLIREVCKVAFAMQTLDPPLDLALASDGELYNDAKLVL